MTEQTNEQKLRANGVYAYRVIDGKHEWDYPGIGKFTVDPDKIEASTRHFLLNYGLRQWVNDGQAKSAGATGKVSATDKYNGARNRAELLNNGTPFSALLRSGSGGGGAFSYVTRALARMGSYMGQDVSTFDKANAFVKWMAEDQRFAKYNFGGQVGKVRAWLEKNSKTIAAEITKIKEEELAGAVEPVDADADLEELLTQPQQEPQGEAPQGPGEEQAPF